MVVIPAQAGIYFGQLMEITRLAHPKRADARRIILEALREDSARKDCTSRAVLSPRIRTLGQITAKEEGILCGIRIAKWVFEEISTKAKVRLLAKDGDRIEKGQVVADVTGTAWVVFAGERVALNLLSHLSGIATETQRYVEKVKPHPAKILDTRKTLPGLRLFQRYAVGVGGGMNHRFDLADEILIKTNHLRLMSGWDEETQSHRKALREAMQRVQGRTPDAEGTRVMVEVANLHEFEEALHMKPDVVLLDNMGPAECAEAVRISRTLAHPPRLEISGGINLANVGRYAETGVDRISVGALTHSVRGLNFSLRAQLIFPEGGRHS
ncbi:MAG: carboxylating nicotinate-nucleotide diphosphorylase [Candidatus Omnitrophica bacterium]|nr:carboxylating nicotinate-nucleotide diphosphorylase [Candidatus Omnitrophota bacterium]